LPFPLALVFPFGGIVKRRVAQREVEPVQARLQRSVQRRALELVDTRALLDNPSVQMRWIMTIRKRVRSGNGEMLQEVNELLAY
jgi:hypothetical protein